MLPSPLTLQKQFLHSFLEQSRTSARVSNPPLTLSHKDSIDSRKTVTEACVLAQASLYRPGETCRGRPEPHSSSRLNEASHSGERGSLKRERVRALARRCGF
ncbi:hypothetical protein DEO72_LG4g1478 [Vigna unguiculata]|uniref:Uncharacterized protein n=1 Tax=Vigna unguiculata TaxID=3917 RepID=A0A4D6LNP3_VIGUN|nr:hypothetical protein DEO72_LG4g1478 [Vigna unguiculata]